jgi:hypothetical protein
MKVQTKQVAFRLPVPLLERLDEHVEILRVDHPGIKVTRADAARLLLTQALDSLDGEFLSTESNISRRRKR